LPPFALGPQRAAELVGTRAREQDAIALPCFDPPDLVMSTSPRIYYCSFSCAAMIFGVPGSFHYCETTANIARGPTKPSRLRALHVRTSPPMVTSHRSHVVSGVPASNAPTTDRGRPRAETQDLRHVPLALNY